MGNSTFEALQLNVRRAFQSGFLFSSNYMWSHSINDGSIGGGESDTPQNSFCRSCDKASSDNDVRLMSNLSAVYQLPFGKGKPYVSNPGIAGTYWKLGTKRDRNGTNRSAGEHHHRSFEWICSGSVFD